VLSNGLASRISQSLGLDKEWLLKNDLKAAVPAIYSPTTQHEVNGQAAEQMSVKVPSSNGKEPPPLRCT
jgi:hypothetical protein